MVYLPFLERFHDDIPARRKRCTLRSKVYGGAGEVVDSPAGKLLILSVGLARVGHVRDHLYRDEGCSSPAEFEEIWRGLHDGAFDPEQERYLHWFVPTGPKRGQAALDVPQVERPHRVAQMDDPGLVRWASVAGVEVKLFMNQAFRSYRVVDHNLDEGGSSAVLEPLPGPGPFRVFPVPRVAAAIRYAWRLPNVDGPGPGEASP